MHEPMCAACLEWKRADTEDRRVAALPTISDEKTQRILSHYAPPVTVTHVEPRAPLSKKAAERAAKKAAKLKKKARNRVIDPLHEALDNLTYVEDAMVTLSAGDDADPTKIAALSKRKSELIREIVEYQKPTEAPPAVDPLEASLANGASLDNVTLIA
jgi:hypothetical protein